MDGRFYYPYASTNKNVFSFRLKIAVSVIHLSSVGKRFKARGAATEKARSPHFSFVLGMTRSCLPADCNDARPGESATPVIKSDR